MTKVVLLLTPIIFIMVSIFCSFKQRKIESFEGKWMYKVIYRISNLAFWILMLSLSILRGRHIPMFIEAAFLIYYAIVLIVLFLMKPKNVY